MSDLVITRQGHIGRITLNRPKALNALTHEMVREMHPALRAFAADEAVTAVVVDGAGERGLCAGGDIRSIYDAQRAGGDLPARFWRDEYIMNAYIARYPKPYVAIMDGIVMGGGVGISAHGSHRIVTQRSRVAMPEVGIGFSPDVGGTWLLAHAPGELGIYAGLTATQMNAADAMLAGFADSHVQASNIAALIDDLTRCGRCDEIDAVISSHASDAVPGEFAQARSWVDACFSHDSVETIMAALQGRAEPSAQKALSAMQRHCPKSLKVALAAIRKARTLSSLEDALQMEYRVSLACIAAPDMVEGIRAVVVDKDQKPRWSPDKLEEVTPQMVATYFAARDGDIIDFQA
jgi:enoyl-CoA hydratase